MRRVRNSDKEDFGINWCLDGFPALTSRAEQDDSLANHPAQSRDLLLPEAKIAALGVHISRGITSHGVAST